MAISVVSGSGGQSRNDSGRHRELAHEIDVERAERALRRAENACVTFVRRRPLRAEFALNRAMARLQAAGRKVY